MTNAMIAGILLPEGTLTRPWFVLLATIVAFNTMIYVGLTVSKLIPWPRQMHPAHVRRMLRRLGADDVSDATPSAPLADAEEPSGDPFEELRTHIVRRDTPQVLGLLGGTAVLLALAFWALVPELDARFDLAQVAYGTVLVVLAQASGRRPTRARTFTTMWACATTLFVGLLAVESVAEANPLSLGLAWIVMTAYASLLLSWRPAIIAGVLMLGSTTLAAYAMEEHAARYAIVGATALVAAATLLRIRLVAISALADERLLVRSLASTDLVTGQLTDRGLLSILPVEAGIAQRTGTPLCLMRFTVLGLHESTSAYGSAYRDDVLRAVASGIRTCLRAGDLVARWSDDEFVAIGLGGTPDAQTLAARVNARITATGVTLGKRPITVIVATSSADPTMTTFDAMLEGTVADVRG